MGQEFRFEFPPQTAHPGRKSSGPVPVGRSPLSSRERPRTAPGPSRIWLEARDYAEAIALAPAWREPLILQLTPENYHAFLAQYRQWDRRRLIWRLPPLIRESALSFFQQAITTLKQGDFSRFIAGDWGAVALVRQAGGEIYGDQTLGVRNSLAVIAARDLTVSKVCLPLGRGPGDWQELLQAAPRGSFWGYLYQLPALAVCAPGNLALPSRGIGPRRGETALDRRRRPGLSLPGGPAGFGKSTGLVQAKRGGPPGDLAAPQWPALGPGAGSGPTATGAPFAAGISPAA